MKNRVLEEKCPMCRSCNLELEYNGMNLLGEEWKKYCPTSRLGNCCYKPRIINEQGEVIYDIE